MIDPGSISSVDEAPRLRIPFVSSSLPRCMMSVVKSIYQDKGRLQTNSWWNVDFLVTRDRQRFSYRLWRSCDQPHAGHVYECYEAAKKEYIAPSRPVTRMLEGSHTDSTFCLDLDTWNCSGSWSEEWNVGTTVMTISPYKTYINTLITRFVMMDNVIVLCTGRLFVM